MNHVNSVSKNASQSEKIAQIMQIIEKIEPSLGMGIEPLGLILPYSDADLRLRKTWHKPRKTLRLG